MKAFTQWIISLMSCVMLLSACAHSGVRQQYTDAVHALNALQPEADGDEEFIQWLYLSRTWLPPSVQEKDLEEIAISVKTPIQNAQVKMVGTTREDALRSLTAKIWMIENAGHTIDIAYFIFTHDLAGRAISGALCNAVKRGVDIRIMVDSIGSRSMTHSELKAIETCADEAGYIVDANGHPTYQRARVHTVIFNALSKLKFNRRSHDKLLIVDGAFPDNAIVMTGGRNISLDYFGITAAGEPDPTAYIDMEILLKPDRGDQPLDLHVGRVSERYYSVLFNHTGNKRIRPGLFNTSDASLWNSNSAEIYRPQRISAQDSLAVIKQKPDVHRLMSEMPVYMNNGFHDSRIRLAHELDNLTNTRVVTNALENRSVNTNSIVSIIDARTGEARDGDTVRIASPYLYLARHIDGNLNVVLDEALDLLNEFKVKPNSRIEIVTNSVLTSDNFFAQSIIDMDTAPRLLLTPKMQAAWLTGLKKGELNPAVVESKAWQAQIDSPQVFIYEVGRRDAAHFKGGTTHYGKLHAKFIVGERIGYVGTSNFNYRSRLRDNEMGFFLDSQALRSDLIKEFEALKKRSYRWGTPEWLQMRKDLMASGGWKGTTTRNQRFLFKFLKFFGIDWHF